MINPNKMKSYMHKICPITVILVRSSDSPTDVGMSISKGYFKIPERNKIILKGNIFIHAPVIPTFKLKLLIIFTTCFESYILNVNSKK